MPCHTEANDVTSSGTLTDSDIYHVTAVTSSVDAEGQPSLALNCDELKTAYMESCARAEGTFEQFAQEAQQAADAGAAEIYTAANALNESFLDNPGAQRILRIRICIRVFRWLRIYIYWKI